MIGLTNAIERSLYGVFFAQAYYYWTTYEEDPIHVKLFVALLWLISSLYHWQYTSKATSHRLLESCHTGFCVHIIYFYFIAEFGNPIRGLETLVW